jgi:uncharacterized protein YegL
MPKLNDPSMGNNAVKGYNYGYSATKIDNLGATEYTLVTIVVDVSGSVRPYKTEMESCMSQIVSACKSSPRSDNLLIRFVSFSSDIQEEHGFKLLENCDPIDYKDSLVIHGATNLFDAAYDSILATNDYAKQLYDNDFCVNGIVFVLTDGGDTGSLRSLDNVSGVIQQTNMEEKLESLVTILIGVGVGGYGTIGKYLKDFQDNSGFTQYQEIKNANEKTLAKLAEFVSKSISMQSKSLGTGGPSKPFYLDI